MKEERRNIWTIPDEEGVKAVTTNGVWYSKEGRICLVMGAGIAKQAASRIPELPFILGEAVFKLGNHPFYVEKHNIISFPTKYDWRDNSSIELIIRSAQGLMTTIEQFDIQHVFLPRPGCSNGGLDWESEVRPAIEDILSDKVTVVWL